MGDGVARPLTVRTHIFFLIHLGMICSSLRFSQAENPASTTGLYGATLGAGAATAAQRMAFGQNPAALLPSETGGLASGFHLDYHRPYGMEDLSVSEAGVYCDFKQGGFQLSWKETSLLEVYHEQGFSFNPSFRFGNRHNSFPGFLDIGTVLTFWRFDFPEQQNFFTGTHGYGLVWQPLPRFKTGGFILGLPVPGLPGPNLEQIWQYGFEATSRGFERGSQNGFWQTLRLDFRKSNSTSWRTLAAWSFNPNSACQLTAAFASTPFQASFGIDCGFVGWRWYQAIRYHRFLGRTILSGLSFVSP